MSFLSQIFKTNTNIKNISAASLKDLMGSGENLQIIDVRTKAEYQQNKIAKSTNIDVFQSDFEQKCESKFDLSKPVLLYCRSGQRSMNAARKLEKIGFEDIYNLRGGMMAWSRVGS